MALSNSFPKQKNKGAPISFGKPDKSTTQGAVPGSYMTHPSTGENRPNGTKPVVGKLPQG